MFPHPYNIKLTETLPKRKQQAPTKPSRKEESPSPHLWFSPSLISVSSLPLPISSSRSLNVSPPPSIPVFSRLDRSIRFSDYQIFAFFSSILDSRFFIALPLFSYYFAPLSYAFHFVHFFRFHVCICIHMSS